MPPLSPACVAVLSSWVPPPTLPHAYQRFSLLRVNTCRRLRRRLLRFHLSLPLLPLRPGPRYHSMVPPYRRSLLGQGPSPGLPINVHGPQFIAYSWDTLADSPTCLSSVTSPTAITRSGGLGRRAVGSSLTCDATSLPSTRA